MVTQQQQSLRFLSEKLHSLLNFHADLGLSYPQAEQPLFRNRPTLPLPASPSQPSKTKTAASPTPDAPLVSPPVDQINQLQKQLAQCQNCPLHKHGSPFLGENCTGQPLLLVIGDPLQPGDQQAFPGQSNELLKKMFAAIELDMAQIALTNICKCPSPEGKPKPAEIKCCLNHLQSQIKLLRPRLLCAMGTMASQALLGQGNQLAALRGRFHDYHGLPLIATYHPSLLLQYPEMKKAAWYDLQLIQHRLRQLNQS